MANKKQVWLVIGVEQSGSASLTWPEDFELVGVYDNEAAADKVAKSMQPEGMPEEPGEDATDDEIDEYDNFDVSEEMTYEVHPVDFFEKKTKKTKK